MRLATESLLMFDNKFLYTIKSIAIALLSILQLSCGPVECEQTYPVSGTLLIDGGPVANVNIAFHRIDRANESMAGVAVGSTAADGRFSLTTNKPSDGARVGDYIVTLQWPDQSLFGAECGGDDLIDHDLLAGRFARPSTTPLRSKINAMNNNLVFSVRQPLRTVRRSQ